MELAKAIILGGLFGFALYVAGASNPSKLTAMLRLQYLTLMKIILFAIGLGSVLLAIANFVGVFNTEHIHIKAMNLGVIIGGLIFGLGFGWAGTCPGTCVAATTGIGFKKAFAAIIGGLLGAFSFSLMFGWWNKIGLFQVFNIGKISLYRISEQYAYLWPGSFFGLLIVGFLFMIGAILLPKDRSM